MIAESYSSLWKKYLYNIDNGHPQTASVVLNKIISKATLEKKYDLFSIRCSYLFNSSLLLAIVDKKSYRLQCPSITYIKNPF